MKKKTKKIKNKNKQKKKSGMERTTGLMGLYAND